MQILIIHSIDCHYENLPSLLHHFKNDDIYTFIQSNNILHNSDDCFAWLNSILPNIKNQNITHLQKIRDLSSLNPDLVIIDTDDDIRSVFYYNMFFHTKKLFCFTINSQFGCRMKNKCLTLPLQGLDKNNYYSCCFEYITPIQKYNIMKNIDRIQISIVGDICRRDKLFFEKLNSRIKNIDECDIHIINRYKPYNYVNKSNYFYHIGIDAKNMFDLLEKSDYVYYFTEKDDNYGIQCSGSFGISCSLLCKYICCNEFKNTYRMNDDIGIFLDYNTGSTSLKKLQYDDYKKIYLEKNIYIQNTKNELDNLLL